MSFQCKLCGQPAKPNWQWCSDPCRKKAWRQSRSDYKAIEAARQRERVRSKPGLCKAVESSPGETWRPVVGYEDRYEVSSLGRVKSLDRLHRAGQHLLRQHVRRHGYLSVRLYRDSVGTRLSVHRLVLTAFAGPCPPKHECCHRDGDPANNSAANLYWGTRAQNVRDIIRHGRNHCLNKTHCKQGHPFDSENTGVYGGYRQCKTCSRNNAREYQRRKREAAKRVVA